MSRIDLIAKAVVGGIISALTALGAALGTTANKTFAEVTAEGWVAVALAFIATFAGVYFVPNTPVEPSQEPVETGYEEGDDELYEGGTYS